MPMNLLTALELLSPPVSDQTLFQKLHLACGFTPLHLKTFLAAQLRLRSPETRFEVTTGLYGDLIGSLQRLQPTDGLPVCAIVEWPDLDPRLGIRSLGGWRSTDIPDIVDSARRASGRLAEVIKQLADESPVYVVTPTLPLPPMFTSRSGSAHHCQCQLMDIAAALAVSLSKHGRVRVISSQRLGELSPFSNRFDVKAEIATGFPYSLQHASVMAELLAALIQNLPPKKGLITDLDDTVWAGILGEIGVDGVAWDMAGHAHMHGLYQQFLESLASMGVLIAVASKNDSALAEQALARKDMLLSKQSLFPLEVHWNPKSESVRRILETWNIGASDVVFVDDSPMEVAEVHSTFPEMDCVVFPKADHRAIWDLLKNLRDQFGKEAVTSEDLIRLGSIRAGSELRSFTTTGGLDPNDFLSHAEAVITFHLGASPGDTRAFELVNKTNQFNLNGKRLTESEWFSFLQDPHAFLLTASYEDKYGPLGKIAVIMGRTAGDKVHVNTWVMSCRAFSRQIEHQCLKFLYEKLKISEIEFDFESTSRNEPIRNLFIELLGTPATSNCSLQRSLFEEHLPALSHRVIELDAVGK